MEEEVFDQRGGLSLPDPVPAVGPNATPTPPPVVAPPSGASPFEDVSDDEEDEDGFDECYLRLIALKTLPEVKEDEGGGANNKKPRGGGGGGGSFFGDMVDLIDEADRAAEIVVAADSDEEKQDKIMLDVVNNKHAPPQVIHLVWSIRVSRKFVLLCSRPPTSFPMKCPPLSRTLEVPSPRHKLTRPTMTTTDVILQQISH